MLVVGFCVTCNALQLKKHPLHDSILGTVPNEILATDVALSAL